MKLAKKYRCKMAMMLAAGMVMTNTVPVMMQVTSGIDMGRVLEASELNISGTGTKSDPYIIKTDEDLVFMHTKMQDDTGLKTKYHFKLGGDVDSDVWTELPLIDTNSNLDGNGSKFYNYRGSLFKGVGIL